MSGDALEESLAAFFVRDEAKVGEVFHGKAADGNGDRQGRCARDWDDEDLLSHGFLDEFTTRVVDAGGACVGDLGHRLAFFNLVDKMSQAFVVGVGVDGAEGLFDAVMGQEFGGDAGVFANDNADLLEGFKGSQGDILEISDGGCDDVERSGHGGVVAYFSLSSNRLYYSRMLPRSLSPLALLLVSACLFGFGCKPGWNDPFAAQRSQRVSGSPAQLAFMPPVMQETPKANEAELAVKEVRSALEMLSAATSFRSSLKLPSSNGMTTAVLEYSKGQGMHGTLQVPGPVTAEVYALGSKTYYRAQSGPWEDLTGTEQGSLLTTQLQQALTLTGEEGESPLQDAKQIVEMSMDRSGCRLVVFRPLTAKDPKETVSVCIKQGYPTFISAQGETAGVVEARYWDFGADIRFTAPR